MLIGVDMGHTLKGADYGASGLREESKLTREVGELVMQKLKRLGYKIINCSCDTSCSLINSLNYRTSKANSNNVDLFISIHFNKFNSKAHGTEVWTYKGKKTKYASRILTNLVKLGFANRGIKNGSNLAVIRNTKAEAMLVECCFCDNKNDMNIYDANKLSTAIVEGITGIKVKSNTNSQPNKKTCLAPKYDESIPKNNNIFKIPNTAGYIEQANDGRLIIHKDRGNYITIGKGVIEAYWNDNNGHSGNERIGGNN